MVIQTLVLSGIGTPNRENSDFNAVITLCEVRDVSFTTSGYREKWVERQIRRVLYLPQDPAPHAINPVVHEICGTLTGLLCDVTGDLNSNFIQR